MLAEASRKKRLLAGSIAALALIPALLLSREVRDRVSSLIAGRPDRPVIGVDPPLHDFGRVKPLAELDADFTVSNLGSRTLELKEPTASCGCQRPSIDRLTLRPGETARLHVHQTAREVVGNVRQLVFIKSNDPIAPEVMIPMDLVVTKGVTVRPEPIFLGGVPAGESVTRTVEIVSDDSVPFRVTHCGTGGGRLLADTTLGAPAVLHRIVVTYRAGEQLGPFDERLVVAVDRPETAPLVIPVRGEVRGPFAVSPSRLSLGAVAGLSETEVKLILRGPPGNILVDEVTIAPEGWHVECAPINKGQGKHLLLRLKVRAPKAGGVHAAELRLRIVGNGKTPIILSVPVLASVHSGTTVQTIMYH